MLLLPHCADPSAYNLERIDAPSDQGIETTTDYPSVVKVVSPGGFGLCTGTFVSPRAVLTAAHCTLTAGQYTVVSQYGIFRTYQVESFGPGVANDPNDLAVLIFDEDKVPAEGVTFLGARPAELEHIRLVGYGCNEIEHRTGAGLKRTGTNQVYRLTDYVELHTPRTSVVARGILGPLNRAGSCFGDSGGPMFRETDEGALQVVGVAHAGSWNADRILSYYIDLNRWDNFDFLADTDRLYDTGILDQCSQALSGYDCSNRFAIPQIFSFLKWVWGKILTLLVY